MTYPLLHKASFEDSENDLVQVIKPLWRVKLYWVAGWSMGVPIDQLASLTVEVSNVVCVGVLAILG